MALGQPLDASQPDVLSAPAADYAAAEQTFLSWVAPDKEATKVEGSYDYNLTSADSQAQGSVSFRAREGDARVVARMTVTEGTALKQIREFEFLEHRLQSYISDLGSNIFQLSLWPRRYSISITKTPNSGIICWM